MSFFNSENWFWRSFGRIADYFMLSILWLFCSIPVVTVGASSVALYDTVTHCVRENDLDMFQRFFRTFKRELGRGVALTVLWGIICLVLNFGYQILCQMAQENSFWNLFSIVYFVTLLLPMGVMCWLVAIQSRFTYGFGQLHRTAVVFAVGYLPYTLAIVVLLVGAINVLLNFPFFLMCLPAVLAHLQSFFIERVFAKHTPVEESPAEGTEEIE